MASLLGPEMSCDAAETIPKSVSEQVQVPTKEEVAGNTSLQAGRQAHI